MIQTDISEQLRQLFGHPALRPGQSEVASNAMAGVDTLAIMPTGSGKSLTYQLPAMLLPGVTVVISPLIALMKDQVESLPPGVREKTALINSTLSSGEMSERLSDVRQGRLKLLYVAPERLRDREFLQALTAAQVSLVVVDEAHCISLWGQDFRPDYLFIPRVLAELGEPTLLAVTATATPEMAAQIGAALNRTLQTVRLSLFRSNLHYEVRTVANRDERVKQVIAICREEKGSGIVYVSSRRDAEEIAAILRDRGVQAIHYHAGMEPRLRAEHQERFMRGKAGVVVATVAFGMGVDKANVRFIVHMSPPDSLEGYAQESGRAGRDGNLARCVLLAAPSDRARLKRNAARSALSIDQLRGVYRRLRAEAVGNWAMLDRVSLSNLAGEDEELDSRVALGLLEQAGLIVRHPDAPTTFSLRVSSTEDTSDQLWRRLLVWLKPVKERQTTIQTSRACTLLECNPVDLERLLAEHASGRVWAGPRNTCIELSPASPAAIERVVQMLETASAQAERRIEQVLSYAANRSECRHVLLAGQFGEHLAACRSSCDVCLGQVAPGPEIERTDRAVPTANDAMLVLRAVRTLPYDMGRTGIVRLLLGSTESRLRSDRSDSFDALSHLTTSSAGRLIDRMVEQGYLNRDLHHEYKLINLTEKGQRADIAALERDFLASGPRPNRMPSNGKSHSEDWSQSPDELQLYERLVAWRRVTAQELNVPAYVVAHNQMLKAVAHARPTSISHFMTIPGVGQSTADKYGPAILAIVAEAE